MKILITGGAGFIGHHLVNHLLVNTDWDIVVIDNLTYASNGMSRLRDINCFNEKRVLILHIDFTRSISDGMTKEIGQIDYFVHMGAESSVDKSLQDALPFAMSNVVGTTNLLEWVKKTQNLKKYIQFSTDEVYGPAPEGVAFDEWSIPKPSNPYAASKEGGDAMAYGFAHAFNIPIIITRTMNVIGERQHPEKFVPKTIRAILNNEKVVLHGQSRENLSSRCWIHARNVASAVMFLLDKSETADMYHIVGEERTVLDLADIICQEIKGRNLLDSEIEFLDFHNARPGHDKRYAMSGEKLKSMGWSPKTDLEESIRKTVKWTLLNRKWLKD